MLQHSLTGHRGAVLCFALWQDRLLFSSSADCSIKVPLLLPAHAIPASSALWFAIDNLHSTLKRHPLEGSKVDIVRSQNLNLEIKS